MLSLCLKTYHNIYVQWYDAGGEFPGRDVKDVKWRRTSPHEAPPTRGYCRSITVVIAVAGTGPVLLW